MNAGLELLEQFNAAREKVRTEMLTQDIQEALVDFGEWAMEMQRDQLRTDETVERLANFLYEYDNGETLAQHVAICWRPDECSVRDSYTRCARAVINQLLGEEP